jgi:hypothetical protein
MLSSVLTVSFSNSFSGLYTSTPSVEKSLQEMNNCSKDSDNTFCSIVLVDVLLGFSDTFGAFLFWLTVLALRRRCRKVEGYLQYSTVEAKAT